MNKRADVGGENMRVTAMDGERRLGLVGLLAILLAVTIAIAPAAFAQVRKEATRHLTQSEAQGAMFGIDMRGYTPTFGFHWRECISIRGDTLYEVDGQVQRGKLRISPEGHACFTYSDSGFQSESCFAIRKRGDGFIFDGVDGSVFVTTSVERGVRTCIPDSERVS